MLTLHQTRRLWQKHVLAENRRDIPGLLATLCEDPIYTFMATGQRWAGREQVALPIIIVFPLAGDKF